MYGIFKSKALRKVMPFKKVLSSDSLLLAELSLQGEFITIPETLMFERLAEGADSTRITRFCSDSRNISNAFFRRYPFLGYFIHVQKLISRTNRFNLTEKIRLTLYKTSVTLEAMAKLVWIREIPYSINYEVGVQFVDIPSKAAEYLVNYIKVFVNTKR